MFIVMIPRRWPRSAVVHRVGKPDTSESNQGPAGDGDGVHVSGANAMVVAEKRKLWKKLSAFSARNVFNKPV
jgi:hypothetical protein